MIRVLVGLWLALGAAQAADFSVVLLDLDGSTMVDDLKCPRDKDGARKCEDIVVLSSVAARALVATFPDEAALPQEEKLKRFELALRVVKGGEIVLSAEDTALLKKLVCKGFNALLCGRAAHVLDPAATAK